MIFWRYYLAFAFIWVSWEAALKMGLNMQKIYQGKCLWKIKSKEKSKSSKKETDCDAGLTLVKGEEEGGSLGRKRAKTLRRIF